ALVDAILPATGSSGKPGLGGAVAAAFVPKNPTWVYGQFFLDAAARSAVCRSGYTSASAGSAPINSGQIRFTSTEGSIVFQNNARDVAEVCRKIALAGDAVPDNVPPQGVDLAASYKTFSDKLLIVLAFYNAAGQETVRVPVMDRSNNYKFFSSGVYGVNLPEGSFTIGQKSAIAGANTFKLLVDFGRGIETFEVTRDKLQ
uniref:hypothetical protein n=1 Tax=Deinococcus sp. TaxID=47478 RepID=UPI0025F0F617